MKILISLTILLVATASFADPSLLEIARKRSHADRANPQKLAEAQQYLSNLYSQKLDSETADDRLNLVTWLVESPQAESPGLSPLLVKIIRTEDEESIREVTMRAMGDLGERKLVETAVIENIFPTANSPFLIFTSVRQEAARSLGKLQRRYPDVSSLPITLSTLEKMAKEKNPLTGAVDGIALCGLEHSEVRVLLRAILNHSGTDFSEMVRIRVVQWYRHAQAALPGMVDELREAAVHAKSPRVRLSAIHTLIVFHQADSATLESLRNLSASPRGMDPATHQYAKNLNAKQSPPELTAGPAITDLCRFVHSRAD